MCETSQWCRSSQILNLQPPQNPLNYYNTATTQIFEIHEIKHNSYKKKINSLLRIAVTGKHSGTTPLHRSADSCDNVKHQPPSAPPQFCYKQVRGRDVKYASAIQL